MKKPLSVLFISGLYPPRTSGGGEISTSLLAEALVTQGHHVTVLTEGKHPSRTQANGVTLQQLPLSLTAKPLFEKRHFSKVAQLVARAAAVNDYDVIHAHDFRSVQLLYFLHHPCKISTTRDYAQICGSPNNLLIDDTFGGGARWRSAVKNDGVREAHWWRKPFRIWQYGYNLPFRGKSFASLDAEVFISRAQQSHIAGVHPSLNKKTAVIYNPIDPHYRSSIMAAPAAQKFLYVGRLQHYKGVDLLLRAFANVLRQMPQATLSIVGEGPSELEYKQYVAHHKLDQAVTFLGRLSPAALKQTYDSHRYLVSPHIWEEPFGRTVIEAMASERLVIAADSGGPAEIINQANAGLLFERNSQSALESALEQAITLSSEDYGSQVSQGRAWIFTHLAPEIVAEQYDNFYESVLVEG